MPEPRADARGPAGVRALRPVREHRTRQLVADRRSHRAQDGRLRDHRVRLRRGHGHAEVHGHRLPPGRASARRRSWSSRRSRRCACTAARPTARRPSPEESLDAAARGHRQPAPRTSAPSRATACPAWSRSTASRTTPTRRRARAHAGARSRRARRPAQHGGRRRRQGRGRPRARGRQGGQHAQRLQADLPGRGARSRRRSPPSRPRSTAPTASSSCPRRARSSSASRSSATAGCRSAWPRRISPSRTIPTCRAPRPASRCRSATLRAYTGAGFVTALCGTIVQMPGLGKTPAGLAIDIDDEGRTIGLF